MRLFIAINFSDEIKNNLIENIAKLKACSKKGNFTKPENLHLTLVFVGETSNVSDITNAMDSINGESFNLTIGGMGKFKRDGGNIYWVGVDKNNILTDIYYKLYSLLQNAGFSIEDREFKPHITLGREVILKEEPKFDIHNMSMLVDKISLMKSERINGKLTYAEIYKKGL